MNNFAAIQLNFFLLILLLIILFYSLKYLDRKFPLNRTFIHLQIMIIILNSLYIIFLIVSTKATVTYIILNKITNITAFSLVPTLLVTLLNFLLKRLNYSKNISKIVLIIIHMLLLINVYLCIVSYNNSGIFFITPENVLVKGDYFFVFESIWSILIFCNVSLFIFNRKIFNYEERNIFLFSVFIPILLLPFENIMFDISTICNSWSITIVLLYIMIMTTHFSKDPLTGLFNRIYYQNYILKLRSDPPQKLAVITIDMDGLKDVNDNFGHSEGDFAIALIGKTIRYSFPFTATAIRHGGDEFVIFLTDSDIWNIDLFIGAVHDKLNDFNLKKLKPYKIEFSYGVCVYDKGTENIDEFLKRSDKLMYFNKRQKKETL